jgi:hypothetical protein
MNFQGYDEVLWRINLVLPSTLPLTQYDKVGMTKSKDVIAITDPHVRGRIVCACVLLFV